MQGLQSEQKAVMVAVIRRRHLITIAIMCGLGLLTNVLVIVATALYYCYYADEDDVEVVSFQQSPTALGYGRITTSTMFQGAQRTVITFNVNVGGETFGLHSSRMSNDEQYLQALPYWARHVVNEPMHSHREAWGWKIIAFGWPLRSAFCNSDIDFADGNVWAVHGGLLISAQADNSAYLPLRPLVVGTVLNSGLYALGWYLMCAAAVCAPRRIRRMRQRCVECGYYLGQRMSSGCPECGWNRSNHPTRQSLGTEQHSDWS